MERILENRRFLKEVTRSKIGKRKRLIQNSTVEELKALVECVLNQNILNSVQARKKLLMPLLKYFTGKTQLETNKVQTHFIKNHSLLQNLVSSVLLKFLQEEDVYCVYNDAETRSED